MTHYSTFFVVLALAATTACSREGPPPIYTSDVFTVYSDRVVQGPFEAKATSDTEIVSTYRHFGNNFMDPHIDFKFAINGEDNEMLSGRDHRFVCLSEDEVCETPLIVFGQQLYDQRPVPAGVYLKPNTKWKIRLDMRKVFEQFDAKGYYETFDGRRIAREEFEGVYVAGGTTPLTWDFQKLAQRKDLELSDEDGDHIFEITLPLNTLPHASENAWKRTLDTRAYPQLTSKHSLVNALYNLSMEEMLRAIEPDSTLRTGKEWAGVWTRDVSYSIILSMAVLQPKVAQYSLLRKIKNGVIIQDTGTGGAYPVSTDRVIWAVAAWEVFKVTGDMDWLRRVYPVIQKSIEADLLNAFDKRTGLMKGESSFLDWREQTYPAWMEPSDIYESRALGTNAVHYQANVVLAAMADVLGDTEVAGRHRTRAKEIKEGINRHLWQEDRSYYAQYLYGQTYPIISPRAEALGEALCVLFKIADGKRQEQLVAYTPVNDFGIPCIHPQIPGVPPYHNNGVWPFVQAYWALAAAKAGNEPALLESLAAIWRPAALFLTNKENFVSSTGDYAATQINSDNMLWSLSGNIALIYKILFGMQYETDHLAFAPFVPQTLAGEYRLTNYRYRNATLDISVSGYGNQISSFVLNDKVLEEATLPSSLEGHHRVEIVLAGNRPGGVVNHVPHRVSPPSPTVTVTGSTLAWESISEKVTYRVLKNGTLISTQSDTSFSVVNDMYAEYQVVAVGEGSVESFASAPRVPGDGSSATVIEAERHHRDIARLHKGYSGSGYIPTTITRNKKIVFQFDVPADGTYGVDIRYANGHGSVKTDNKCAVRTLTIDGIAAGTIVLPQRGTEAWSNWGFSNRLLVDLTKGKSDFALEYAPHNANMNGIINEANIDYLRIVRIK